MRFVPTNCLREGMQLAKVLYGVNNEKLLSCGTVLTRGYIESIKRLRYPGVYINDEISKDVEIQNVISDKLRMETMKGIKDMFIKAEGGSKQIFYEDKLINNIENIVDELIDNKCIMVNMIDLKYFDNYTYAHSVNVAVLSIILGIALGFQRKRLINLGLGAILHDIGKVFINKDLIRKPGKLTDEEFEIVKMHPILGYKYMKDKFKIPLYSHNAILDHHERFDGSGYPNGKKRDQITFFGRIIAVVDVYDALSSERPYRNAISPSDCIEYIVGSSGILFDPKIVTTFTRKIAPYPVGTTVRLSNGYIGLVIENHESFCLRPTVRVVKINGETVEPFEVYLKDDHRYLNVIVDGVSDYC